LIPVSFSIISNTIALYLLLLETSVKLLAILVVASVPSSSLESAWMAIEVENREMLMPEAVNTDLALGGKYLGNKDVTSCSLDHTTIFQKSWGKCMQ
jgi:hypothetical protein